MIDAGLPRPVEVEHDPFGAGASALSGAIDGDALAPFEVDEGSYAHAQGPIADDEDALDDALATTKQALTQLRVTIHRYL